MDRGEGRKNNISHSDKVKCCLFLTELFSTDWTPQKRLCPNCQTVSWAKGQSLIIWWDPMYWGHPTPLISSSLYAFKWSVIVLAGSFFLAKIKPQTQIEKKQEGTYSLPLVECRYCDMAANFSWILPCFFSHKKGCNLYMFATWFGKLQTFLCQVFFSVKSVVPPVLFLSQIETVRYCRPPSHISQSVLPLDFTSHSVTQEQALFFLVCLLTSPKKP